MAVGSRLSDLMGDSLDLTFETLRKGGIGLSAAYGSFLAEAASHCLRHHNHKDPTFILITGDHRTSCTLARCAASQHEKNTWTDLHEATEYGAYGVGIVVALRLMEKSRVERSVRGTGVDYWIGDGTIEDEPFQRSARLEISGILAADEAGIAARLGAKLQQTRRSSDSGLPAYVIIIDFLRPEARFVQAKAGARP